MSSSRSSSVLTRADDPAAYDPIEFPQHPLAVDVVALSVLDGGLAAMLVRRAVPPSRGALALPGVFVGHDEALEDAARRALVSKASVDGLFLEQLYTFGDPGRDPRGRVVSVTYYALAPGDVLASVDRAKDVSLLALDAQGVAHTPDHETVELAFDHARILAIAVERLRGKLWYSPVALALAGDSFTLHELQVVYEAILGRKLSKPAFRRRILAGGLVEPADGRREGSHRPAALYRANHEPEEFRHA